MKKGDLVKLYGATGNSCFEVRGVGKKMVTLQVGACDRNGFQPFTRQIRIPKNKINQEISGEYIEGYGWKRK